MANASAVQILADGPSMTVVKFDFVLDTSDLASTIVIDFSTLYADGIGNTLTQVRIDDLQWSVQAPLSLNLVWDASTDVRTCSLSASSKEFLGWQSYGGLPNNSGAGKTGDILATTTGYTSGTLTGTLIMKCVKQ